MLKSILSQAIAMAFVLAFNHVLSMILHPPWISCWWGIVALWILIDGEGIHRDLKSLTAAHDDLLRRYQEIYIDNRYMMKQRYDQCRHLVNIVMENNAVLRDVKIALCPEKAKEPSPLIRTTSARFLHLSPKNRLSLMGKSCVF